MINGILNIYKEPDFTSFDVIAKLRGILKQKKIGHTGTLDPKAEGVLPVCLGSGTKLCDMLTDHSKEYVAELMLGVVTDTQDMTGTVLRENAVNITEYQFKEVAMSFLGKQEQIPPMYSAKKVNGKKLYQLAREGKEVERKPSNIEISQLEILAVKMPIVKLRIVCSKGTYIRTICHDIGALLGCGGCMKSLVRTRVGVFGIEESLTLSQIEKLRDAGTIDSYVVPVDYLFEDYETLIVSEASKKFVENGNKLQQSNFTTWLTLLDKQWVRIYNEEHRFYGIYEYQEAEQILEPKKLFLGNNE